jgi:hypothetical protein
VLLTGHRPVIDKISNMNKIHPTVQACARRTCLQIDGIPKTSFSCLWMQKTLSTSISRERFFSPLQYFVAYVKFFFHGCWKHANFSKF